MPGNHTVRFCLLGHIYFCQQCQSRALDILINLKNHVTSKIECDYEFLGFGVIAEL